MRTPIRVLIVEDHIPDAGLMVRELHQAGFELKWQRVENKTHYLAQLDTLPDIILADHSLPQFSAPEALDLLKQRGLDIPFIVVTGTLSEEIAVEHIKEGAADYILKDRMVRLGAAVTRALEEKRLREEKRKADVTLQARYRELQTLHKLSQEVLNSLDLQTFLNQILDQAVHVDSFDLGTILLADPDDKRVQAAAVQGYRHPANVQRPPRERMPARAHHRAFAYGKTFIVENIAETQRLQTLKKEGVQSAILVPVRAGAQTLGFIQLGSRTRRKFDTEKIRLVEAIGNQMGIAIQKARLDEEVKRKVRQLEQKTAELEQASRVKDEFLRVMSHELRTPLTVVTGYVGMLEDGFLGKMNPDQVKTCGKILRSTEDLLNMVNSILYTTALEAKTVNVASRPVDLAALLSELRSAYDGSLKEGLALIWNYAAELPPLSTDGAKLKQILQNLIDNAIKFTETGSVTVSVRAGKGGRAGGRVAL